MKYILLLNRLKEQRETTMILETFAQEFGNTRPMFIAGNRVPAGTYVNVETGRVVNVQQGEALPASLDGHVATYVKRPPTWADITSQPRLTT